MAQPYQPSFGLPFPSRSGVSIMTLHVCPHCETLRDAAYIAVGLGL